LEIKVLNEIINILNNFQNICSVLVLEHDYVLDFADLSELHGPQIEYITAAEEMMKMKKSTSIIREELWSFGKIEKMPVDL